MTPEARVVALVEHQEVAAGGVLARAFASDPLAAFLFPAGPARQRLLGWHYTALVRYGRLAGAVDVALDATGRPAGAAVWLPGAPPGSAPGEGLERLERLERAGLLQAPDVLGAETFGRLVAVVGSLERRRQQAVPGPHWYLNQVAVDPDWQGRGIGSALLTPGLLRAAGDGLPCYLETFREANLTFYARLGFQVVSAEVEPSSGLPFWACLRPEASQPLLNDA